jgi:hypothetical protein
MAEPQTADGLDIWYMHDNHTFTKLYGKTLTAVLKRADEVEAQSSYGMLCPAHVLQGKQELRRVGPCVHAGSSKDTKDKWNAGKAAWKAAMKADADVMRLLPFNARDEGCASIPLDQPVKPNF